MYLLSTIWNLARPSYNILFFLLSITINCISIEIPVTTPNVEYCIQHRQYLPSFEWYEYIVYLWQSFQPDLEPNKWRHTPVLPLFPLEVVLQGLYTHKTMFLSKKLIAYDIEWIIGDLTFTLKNTSAIENIIHTLVKFPGSGSTSTQCWSWESFAETFQFIDPNEESSVCGRLLIY